MAGKKILVADDSLTIQKVIRLALSNEGYEIQTVSEGNEALHQISTFRPDLVLVDISLPGQNAIEIKNAVSLVDDLGATAFVLMSSAFEKVDEAKVSEAQFDGRLTKPFDPAHLRAVLSEVLARPSRKPQEKPVAGGSKIEVSATSFEEMPPLPPTGLPAFEFKGGEGADSDIKKLTESTIRMSGLDDMAWSVNEPVIKPSSRVLEEPPPSLMRSGPPPVAAPPSEISGGQLDQLIQAKVEEQVSRLAQRMFPELAERVIKQEINRLLRELN